jgi:hypothetical protein
MGKRRRQRPTHPKQRRVGVARPMKDPLLINHLDQLRSSKVRLQPPIPTGRPVRISAHVSSWHVSDVPLLPAKVGYQGVKRK